MQVPLLTSMLLLQAIASPAEGQPDPVRLLLGQEGGICLVELEKERFRFPAGADGGGDRQRLQARLLALKSRGVELQMMLMPDLEPQYRCVGGILFRAHRLGMRVGIVSEPPRSPD